MSCFRRYFKNNEKLKFYGIKAPVLHKAFAEHYKSELSTLELPKKLELAKQLILSPYAEQKSFAVSVLAKNVKQLDSSHMTEFGTYFDGGHIFDWATCDTLSSRVIAEMVRNESGTGKKTKKQQKQDTENAKKARSAIVSVLVSWKDSESVWKKRSSCVSFVKLARFGDFTEDIIEICTTCVKSEERFVQLGNGWVLRELSRANLKLVIQFIKDNYNYFSREGLRYAIEKMDQNLRQKLLMYRPGLEDSEEEEDKDSSEHSELSESSSSASSEPRKKKGSTKVKRKSQMNQV